jgi:predicted nucleic acid-binding Zn finger protein
MATTSNPQINPIAQIRALHDRLARAEELVAEGKVHPVVNMADHYIVQGSQGYYLINGSCTCPDFTNRTDLIKGYCKHRLSALLYAEQQAQAETTHASKPKAKKAESSQKDEELERNWKAR